jgi:hypothetical protein
LSRQLDHQPGGRWNQNFKYVWLVLRSNLYLQPEAGAVLRGSVSLADYPQNRPAFRSYTDTYTDRRLIYAEKVENCGILVQGTIDGQGKSFSGPYKARPYMIRVISSKNITVQDVAISDSPMWVQHYLDCDNVAIRGITVQSLVTHNNDGIGAMRNIIIRDLQAKGASMTGCAIAGIPGHAIEDVTLGNIRLRFAGGGTAAEAAREVPENEAGYAEYKMFGTLPAYGFYLRHVRRIRIREIETSFGKPDARPASGCRSASQDRELVPGMGGQKRPGNLEERNHVTYCTKILPRRWCGSRRNRALSDSRGQQPHQPGHSGFGRPGPRPHELPWHAGRRLPDCRRVRRQSVGAGAGVGADPEIKELRAERLRRHALDVRVQGCGRRFRGDAEPLARAGHDLGVPGMEGRFRREPGQPQRIRERADGEGGKEIQANGAGGAAEPLDDTQDARHPIAW